jgi:hypothetical protein
MFSYQQMTPIEQDHVLLAVTFHSSTQAIEGVLRKIFHKEEKNVS